MNMNKVDAEYNRLVELVLNEGKLKKNRTGIDTIGVFGAQSKFDINLDAFPILTTKKVFFKGIVHELLWFISGDNNIKYLVDNNVHIWDEWAYVKFQKDSWLGNKEYRHEFQTQEKFIQRIKDLDKDDWFVKKFGDLGVGTYGGMWRDFPYSDYFQGADLSVELESRGIDQLQKVLNSLKYNPDDRRMIVNSWHPYWVDKCALPPCHCLFHFNTEELTHQEMIDEALKIYINGDKEYLNGLSYKQCIDDAYIPKRRLNCLLYQRSADLGLGIPFNITSYCLLTAMIAHCVRMVSGTFTHTYGDLHIYKNHIPFLSKQITNSGYDLPRLRINTSRRNLFDLVYEDIQLENYVSQPTIKMDIAV